MKSKPSDIFFYFKESIRQLSNHIKDTDVFENSINSYFTNIKYLTVTTYAKSLILLVCFFYASIFGENAEIHAIYLGILRNKVCTV